MHSNIQLVPLELSSRRERWALRLIRFESLWRWARRRSCRPHRCPRPFFGAWLFGIAGRTDFFGMRIWGFGFGLIRFEFATSFAPRFRFTSFFFGIKISSYSESSSSESSSLNASRSDGGSFFHWESGKTFVISKDPFFPHTYLNPKNTTPEKWWSFTIPKYNLILFAAVTFRDETNLFVSMPNICKIAL